MSKSTIVTPFLIKNDQDKEEARSRVKSVIDSALKGNEDVLDMANLIYAQQGFTVKQDYLDLLSQTFGVQGLKQLDFVKNGGEAKQVINGDVEKATRGKIKNIVETVDPSTVLILINAIYFNGKWVHAFNEAITNKTEFTCANGEEREVMMMHRSFETLFYGESSELGARAILLPYQDTSVKMLLILPNEPSATAVKELENKLTSGRLTDLLASMDPARVNLWLPRFKIEAEHQLERLVQDMGATHMFDGALADFSGISEQSNIPVSEIIQKAVIEVEEKGTVAAAATMIRNVRCCMPVQQRVDFRCDRPFLYMLIIENHSIPSSGSDESSNNAPNVVFIGSLKNPPNVA